MPYLLACSKTSSLKLLVLFILLAGCGGTRKAPAEQPQETIVLDSVVEQPVEQPQETIVWDSTAERGIWTDSRDGKTYKITKIGEQVWMAENLNYNVSGSKCYGEDGLVYDKDELYKDERGITLSSSEIQANCDKYGRLYDWAAAMAVCPSGWRLPSNADWDKLYRYADGDEGMENLYYSKMAGKYLKSKEGWNDYKGKSGNGEDTYSFSALPGGGGYSGDDFYNVGDNGYWWSSSANNSNYAYLRGMDYYDDGAYWYHYDKDFLFSVRCVGTS
jgi:uncharacterized protein (TIGR02145 family)